MTVATDFYWLLPLNQAIYQALQRHYLTYLHNNLEGVIIVISQRRFSSERTNNLAKVASLGNGRAETGRSTVRPRGLLPTPQLTDAFHMT